MGDLEANSNYVTDLPTAARDFASEVAGTTERTKKSLPAPEGLQMFLLYIRANGNVPTHQTTGPITVQTLVGTPTFTVGGHSHVLPVGSVISVAGGAPHALSTTDESVLLVTHAL